MSRWWLALAACFACVVWAEEGTPDNPRPLADDLMAPAQLLLPQPHILSHQRRQMVNVVEVAIVEMLHVRIDVPRDHPR